MLVLLVGPTYMFSTLVWTMSTPHSNLESGIMCLFNRDHISATVGFDEDYKFSADEMALQRIHRATMNGSSTILSALECKLWKQPRLGLQIHLLRRLQDLSPTRSPTQVASSMTYRLTLQRKDVYSRPVTTMGWK